MNGETEDQTQNGTEPMESLELGSGSVALRRHKKAATISHPNRLSYHEAIRIEEVRDRERERGREGGREGQREREREGGRERGREREREREGELVRGGKLGRVSEGQRGS